MNESPPALPAASATSTGRIVTGIAFILGWGVVHLVLFYLFFASGIVVDVLLSVVKSVMFPGASLPGKAAHELLGWSGILQTGLIIAGAAGIPGGLAFFCNEWRKFLRRLFWVLLIPGGACEISAVIILIRSAFTVPT